MYTSVHWYAFCSLSSLEVAGVTVESQATVGSSGLQIVL